MTSTTIKITKRHFVLLSAMIVVQCLFALAVALVAVYEQPGSGMSYATPLSWSLADGICALTLDDVRRVLTFGDLVFLISSWTAIVTLLPTFRQVHSRLRCGIFGLQCVVLFWGWFGLYLMPFDVLQILHGTMDGEWIGESSPIYQAVGLWLVVSSIGTFMSFNRGFSTFVTALKTLPSNSLFFRRSV